MHARMHKHPHTQPNGAPLVHSSHVWVFSCLLRQEDQRPATCFYIIFPKYRSIKNYSRLQILRLYYYFEPLLNFDAHFIMIPTCNRELMIILRNFMDSLPRLLGTKNMWLSLGSGVRIHSWKWNDLQKSKQTHSFRVPLKQIMIPISLDDWLRW